MDVIEFLCLLKSELLNNALACAAILISMAALGLAVYEGWAARKHNRLSVLPHLNLEFELSKDLNPVIGLYLVNTGLGPGKIREFIIETDDGSQFDGSTQSLANLCVRLNSEQRPPINLSAIIPNQMIKVNDEIAVIGMTSKKCSPEQETNFIDGICKIKAKVKFKDIYGKKYESDWKRGKDLVVKLKPNGQRTTPQDSEES